RSAEAAEDRMAHYIIGVHDGHNASAAILNDGELVFAVQEERLTGRKNHSGFPFESIKACLAAAGIAPRQVAQLALGTMRRTPTPRRSQDMAAAFQRDASLKGFVRRLLWYGYVRFNEDFGLAERLRAAASLGFTPPQIKRYDHHLGHAATAYYGMREDPGKKYLIITMDGVGDLNSCTVNIAEGSRITRLSSTPLTDSLGTIYGLVTGALGFVPLEHEYKLMGMAPYASADHARQMADRLRSLL